MSIRRTLTIAATLASLVGVLLVSTPALGWTVNTDVPYVVHVVRTASDTTAAVTWKVYSRTQVPNVTQWSDGSWETTSNWSVAVYPTLLMPSDARSFDYQMTAMMYLFYNSTTGEKFTVMNSASWSLPVNLLYVGGGTQLSSAGVPVYGSVTATVTNPASSTVSVAGTLPVSVSSLGGFSSTGIDALLAVGVLLGGFGVGTVLHKKFGARGSRDVG